MRHVGCDELVHSRWKSRWLLAVVSLSFGVGETSCSQGKFQPVTIQNYNEFFLLALHILHWCYTFCIGVKLFTLKLHCLHWCYTVYTGITLFALVLHLFHWCYSHHRGNWKFRRGGGSKTHEIAEGRGFFMIDLVSRGLLIQYRCECTQLLKSNLFST